LEKTCRVERLRLVSLASNARTHKLLHQTTVVIHNEVLAKSLQGLLNPFVTHGVSQLHDRRHQRRRWRDEDLSATEDKAIHHPPRVTASSYYRVAERTKSQIILKLAAQHIIQLE
jgi:hypothetical protein